MRIMIIDDDQDFCHLTKLALSRHGYEVAAAFDVATGIKYAQNYRPDLILMDVMMPEISGAEAIQLLKADAQLKNTPVVFLTGLVSGAENVAENTGLNVDGLNYRTLGKPYEIEKLLEVVQNALTKKN